MAVSTTSHLTAVEAHVSEADNSTLSPTPDIDLKDMKGQVEENVYPAEESVPQFPDGGFWAWSTVAGAFLVQYCTFGYINAFGVYQDYYVRIYLTHYTPSTIGWIGGMQIFLNFGMGVVTGRLFDRGYFRYLMATSIVLHAIALFMLSLSHENKYYQVFLTNGVAFGAASGITYVPSLGIVSHYFHRRRALALGIVSSGSALGAVLNPIMLNKLFSSRIGFHNGIRISAGLNVFLLLVSFTLMRTRMPPKPVHHFPIKDWVLKQHEFSLALLTCIFTFFALFFPVFYLQLNAIVHGVDRNIAFYSLPILNACSVIGRLVPNAISHKFGISNLIVVFTFLTGAVTFTFPAVKNLEGTILFAVFWGFVSGAFISLVPAYINIMSNDPSETGTRLGLFFGTGSIIGLFATPITGALLTDDYHWLNPSIFSGICFMIGGFLSLISRNIIAKKRGTHLV